MTLPPLLGIVEQAKCGCRTKSAHWLHRQTPRLRAKEKKDGAARERGGAVFDRSN